MPPLRRIKDPVARLISLPFLLFLGFWTLQFCKSPEFLILGLWAKNCLFGDLASEDVSQDNQPGTEGSGLASNPYVADPVRNRILTWRVRPGIGALCSRSCPEPNPYVTAPSHHRILTWPVQPGTASIRSGPGLASNPYVAEPVRNRTRMGRIRPGNES